MLQKPIKGQAWANFGMATSTRWHCNKSRLSPTRIGQSHAIIPQDKPSESKLEIEI